MSITTTPYTIADLTALKSATPTARERFRLARSLYRRGAKNPETVVDRRITRSGRNPFALYSFRAECEVAGYLVSGMHDRAHRALPAATETPARVLSVLRWQYESARANRNASERENGIAYVRKTLRAPRRPVEWVRVDAKNHQITTA